MSTPEEQGMLTEEQVSAMIETQLSKLRDEHEKEMSDVRAQLAAAQRVAANIQTFVPENAGGPGTEVAETWSAWEQHLQHQAREACLAVTHAAEASGE